MRKNLEELHKVIGGKHNTSPESSTSVTSSQNELPKQYDHTINNKKSTLLQKSDFLHSLFSPTKREEDKRYISQHVDNKNNGIYLFLKTFTTRINANTLDETFYDGQQHLDLVDMRNYLSFIQREQIITTYP